MGTVAWFSRVKHVQYAVKAAQSAQSSYQSAGRHEGRRSHHHLENVYSLRVSPSAGKIGGWNFR